MSLVCTKCTFPFAIGVLPTPLLCPIDNQPHSMTPIPAPAPAPQQGKSPAALSVHFCFYSYYNFDCLSFIVFLLLSL